MSNPKRNEVRFSIAYYEGDGSEYPPLKEYHETINDAAKWCIERNIPLSIVSVTEWDIEGEADYDGVFDIVGQCNLDEAFEMQYERLDF